MRLTTPINWLVLAAVGVVGALMMGIALSRITIDMDIVRSLPTDDPVIADAIHMFRNNPVKDRIAIDIGSVDADPERLVAVALMVEGRMQHSGLFQQVGNASMQQGLGDLADHVVGHLPFLFSANQLQQQVLPRLAEDRIRQALGHNRDALYQMDGIGQAQAIAADPLGLRHLVLARLAALNPAPGTTIHRGRILAADRRHLLVLATPVGSGTDTAVARDLTRYLNGLATAVEEAFGKGITLTPTGAYRAALDNERIVKGDVQRAILWATIGIAVLLLAAFSRPWTGLLALLPALAGTVAAFFVFALMRESISIMVLGFGGAIISITVDHGIAYMLFVDSGGSGGRDASQEIRAVGLLAVLTSVGAFGILAFSGFAVFEQLGLFTAMGIGFAFLFVHTVFPKILSGGHASAIPPRRRFSRIIDRLAATGKSGLAVALITAAVLAAFIRPHFNTALETMNSVSPQTQTADRLMTEVWGDIFSSVYVMTEAQDLASLQRKSDLLLELLDTEKHAGGIAETVTSSLFFPGPNHSAQHAAAWRQFWTRERIRTVSAVISQEAGNLGFADNAFKPFLDMLTQAPSGPDPIPAGVQPLLGISRDDADGRWRQVIRVTPHSQFDSQRFYARISPLATVFDPSLFSQRMGRLLFGTFMKMLLIIGVSLVALLAIFFADAGLLLTALLPLAFAFVCTLGTLGLMGRPLDIPALMLGVIILGMGVDYTLLLVRGYQRYQRFDHPHLAVIRAAVVMAAASTLVGFAVLLGADHGLLQSAGWISFLGIGYCLAGALLILPPLLKRRFETTPAQATGVDWRYRNMEPYPRMFARFKQRLDPLFAELEALAPPAKAMANILDIGCGYGVPACWLADRYPKATIHGVDPNRERVRVAALALGDRGRIVQAAAPDLPSMDVLLDMATALDMSHYLQDWELEKMFERIHERLLPGGVLIMRSVLPPPAKPHWTWHLEHCKMKLDGLSAHYRRGDAISGMLERCDFMVLSERPSGRRGDMVWHVARPR